MAKGQKWRNAKQNIQKYPMDVITAQGECHYI
jgi:hypothetical protein